MQPGYMVIDAEYICQEFMGDGTGPVIKMTGIALFRAYTLALSIWGCVVIYGTH